MKALQQAASKVPLMADIARLSEAGRCFLKVLDRDEIPVDDEHEFVGIEQFEATDRLKRFDAKHQRFHFRFPEAIEPHSFAIPRQSVTVGGYLRAGEKKTPRRVRAHSGELYAHITRRAVGCKPPGRKTFARGSLPASEAGFPTRLVLPLCGQTEGSDKPPVS